MQSLCGLEKQIATILKAFPERRYCSREVRQAARMARVYGHIATGPFKKENDDLFFGNLDKDLLVGWFLLQTHPICWTEKWKQLHESKKEVSRFFESPHDKIQTPRPESCCLSFRTCLLTSLSVSQSLAARLFASKGL